VNNPGVSGDSIGRSGDAPTWSGTGDRPGVPGRSISSSPGAGARSTGWPGSRVRCSRRCTGSTLARQRAPYGPPSSAWDGDLSAQRRDLVPQHEDLRVIARQERQPAERLDHEQTRETDEHERRA
jgi:hypothetical protein